MKRTVLLFGGTGGIGMAAAKRFWEAGDQLIVTGTRQSRLDAALKAMPGAKGMLWDLSESERAREQLDRAISLFGRIDVAVNCAGVLSEADRANDFFAVTPEVWRRVESVNLEGVFFVCQALAEYMISERIQGHIVNVCSEMGFRPIWYPYGASKWGVRGLTYGLGRLLAPYGIVVNGIAPGHTATEMVGWSESDSLEEASIPRGVMARPEEIADTIFYLAGDGARNIMGHIVVSDGARHLY